MKFPSSTRKEEHLIQIRGARIVPHSKGPRAEVTFSVVNSTQVAPSLDVYDFVTTTLSPTFLELCVLLPFNEKARGTVVQLTTEPWPLGQEPKRMFTRHVFSKAEQ